ncbi:MAG: YkgJ family cysteine cluster protein [Desulfamplus sp.]|nr:YkgJ family cysteine cluster protein [Desulfamplus sp.]
MSEDMIPIGSDEILPFKCLPDVSCFNECCRDLNQVLTPYDILRLKRSLSIKSDIFLKKYTSRHNGPGSGLPVITFKADPSSGYACPLVRESGCSVYDDRPASCRMYPLARAIVRSRETGELTEHFALIEEPHCNGFGHKNGYPHRGTPVKYMSVREWLKGQDVDLHNEMNDKMMEIISLKNRIMPGKLDGVDADRFYLACYDLDTFRDRIIKDALLDNLNMPLSFLEKVRRDDIALLELGMSWVKNILFGIEINLWN